MCHIYPTVFLLKAEKKASNASMGEECNINKT